MITFVVVVANIVVILNRIATMCSGIPITESLERFAK